MDEAQNKKTTHMPEINPAALGEHFTVDGDNSSHNSSCRLSMGSCFLKSKKFGKSVFRRAPSHEETPGCIHTVLFAIGRSKSEFHHLRLAILGSSLCQRQC